MTIKPSDAYHFTRVSADSMALPDNAITTNAQIASTAAIAREKLAQDVLAVYPLRLDDARVWDALSTFLPTSTAANDDMYYENGTLGSSEAPELKTEDKASNGAAESQICAFVAELSPEYDDAETVQIRVAAKMTAVADVSQTVDVSVYLLGRDGTLGTDLVTTAATNINSTSYADKDFTITATGLAAGDQLLIVVTIAIRDDATGSGVAGAIGAVELLADIRG